MNLAFESHCFVNPVGFLCSRIWEKLTAVRAASRMGHCNLFLREFLGYLAKYDRLLPELLC